MKNQSIVIGICSFIIVFVSVILLFGVKIPGISFIRRQISQITLNSPVENQKDKTLYYQEKVKQFRQNPGSQEDIFLVGDSLTDQGNWTQLLNQNNIKNRGISGDTTTGVLNRLDDIINAQPKKIFIMIGINDLWNEDRSIEQILANYQKIVTSFQEQTPQTQVYIQSLLPINNRDYSIKINNQQIMEMNQKLELLATQFNYQYLPIYPQFVDEFNQLKTTYTDDGVHLTSEGYRVWAKAILTIENF